MKRILTRCLDLVLATCLFQVFAGCGGGEESATTIAPTTAAASTGTTVAGVPRVGFLAWVGSTPAKDRDYAKNSAGKIEDVTHYPTLEDLIAAVKSGEIDRGIVVESTAKYVTCSDDTLASTVNPNRTVTAIAMAVGEGDDDLLSGLNDAITAMKEDGTLDSLVAEYITGVAPGEIPAAVAISSIAGADTIKVAVTGDIPPLDCFDAAGNPVGFSTALMAEISKRAGVNVQFVKVNVAERGTAITGGQADAALWARGYDHGSGKPPVFIPDTLAGTVISTPYHSEAEYLIHLPGYTMPAE